MGESEVLEVTCVGLYGLEGSAGVAATGVGLTLSGREGGTRLDLFFFFSFFFVLSLLFLPLFPTAGDCELLVADGCPVIVHLGGPWD